MSDMSLLLPESPAIFCDITTAR